MIVFYRSIDPVLQDRKVQPDIQRLVLFPGQRAVSYIGRHQTRLTAVIRRAILRQRGIETETIRVSCLTIRNTQLQQIEKLLLLHELFLIDIPAGAHRIKGAPAMFSAENRRLIPAQTSTDDIPVFIVEIPDGEFGKCGLFAGGGRGRRGYRGIGQIFQIQCLRERE